MTPNIVNAAIKELVEINNERFRETWEKIINDNSYISINRAAGLLEIHPDTARNLFKDHIIEISKRQHRVPIRCIKEVAESMLLKTQRKNKRLDAMKDQGRLDI
jgi:hypothetical protein